MKTISHQRLAPADRAEQITAVALKLASRKGLYNITRDEIAAAANVSAALVSARLGTMVNMRRTLMRAAVANAVLPIIAEGLVRKNPDPIAMKCSPEIRAKALATLV